MKTLLMLASVSLLLSVGCAGATLVPCASPHFKSPNDTKSLMSWSDSYHQKAVSGEEQENACTKALEYRGSAHCKSPIDPTIRSALRETIAVCTAVAGTMGIEIPASEEGEAAPAQEATEPQEGEAEPETSEEDTVVEE